MNMLNKNANNNKMTIKSMRGSKGGGASVPDPPPWNLQSLISPILLEMKKLVIFNICDGFFSYLRLDPLEKFSGSAPVATTSRICIPPYLSMTKTEKKYH